MPDAVQTDTAAGSAMIDIRGLYKIFGPDPQSVMPLVTGGIGKQELLDVHGHVLGLKDINLPMAAQGIQVVMGLSGSGKSTLIRHINRLIEPTAGEVVVGGRNVLDLSTKELREFRRNRASMVFQRFALLPHRTVGENVAYGLKVRGVAGAEADRQVAYWIERVGLAGYENHFPNQLSGGMQQRVGLGRALATDADILLMDEAFSALDPLIRYDMQDVLLDLQSELRKTIVFITHDLDEALRIGDSIAILRDGEVIQHGDAQQIVLHPADDYIADFVKDINRGRVIKLRSIMMPLGGHGGGSASGPEVDGNLLLEDAARIFAEADAPQATVVDDTGKPVGTVGMAALMRAMVRSEAR